MKIQHLIVAAALVAIATPALATVKVYSSHPQAGMPGDAIMYATGLCPPIDPTLGTVFGENTLTDAGGGFVTLTDHQPVNVVFINYGTDALTGIFGPGSFVFVNNRSTWFLSGTPIGTGGTDPGESMTWGVVGGWKATGRNFCIASPQTVCTGSAMVPHGTTVPTAPLASPTYDLGTWSFDMGTGDLTGSPYITGTFNGGTSNRQRVLRGAYVGASVPALPLIGAAALALGFLVAGTRSVMRKK